MIGGSRESGRDFPHEPKCYLWRRGISDAMALVIRIIEDDESELKVEEPNEQ